MGDLQAGSFGDPSRGDDEDIQRLQDVMEGSMQVLEKMCFHQQFAQWPEVKRKSYRREIADQAKREAGWNRS